jgi:hypothetical protein
VIVGAIGVYLYRRQKKGGSGILWSPPAQHNVIPIQSILDKNSSPWYSSGVNKSEWSVDGDTLTVKIKKGVHGGQSGGAFDVNPNKMFPSNSVTFSYDVLFKDGFDFVKGGKLPGVCLGAKSSECANGGNWQTSAGSVRPMWRADNGSNPIIIGYIYLPDNKGPKHAYDYQGAAYKQATRPGDRAGHDVWLHEKSLKLSHGWNSIRVTIKMNTPGKNDGVLEMSVNDTTRRVDDIMYRKSADIQINKGRIVSFFGGGSDDWNSPKDTSISFKNFTFSV